MIKSYLKPLLIAVVASLFIVGCGNSTTNTGTLGKGLLGFNGKFVDAPVNGIGWSCDNVSGLTKDGGKFGTCPQGSAVTFSLGGIVLGSLTQTDDFIFTPQDLAGAGRDATDNPIALKITSLILSLAEEKDGVLVLKSDVIEKFEEEVGADIKNIDAITSDIIKDTVENIGETYVDEDDAKEHLDEQATVIENIIKNDPVVQPTDGSTN